MASAPAHERALAVPGVAAFSKTCPAIVLEYFEKLSSRLRLGLTARRVLDAFGSIDVKSDRITEFLEANPYYGSLFLAHVQAVSRRENLPGIAASVVLLGMENSRNLLVALQIQKMVHGGSPSRKDSGQIEIGPKEMLKSAIAAETALQALPNAQGAYPETAYLGGLVFDILQMLAAAMHPSNKALPELINRVRLHGATAGQFAFSLTSSLQDFSFKKYVRPTAMIHGAGKAVMALLRPEEYVKFDELMLDRKPPLALRIQLERETFGADHALMGYLLARDLGIFRQVEQALLHYHQPYMLARNKSLGQLASMTLLASNVASDKRKPTTDKDPIYRTWMSHELDDFPVTNEAILKAMA